MKKQYSDAYSALIHLSIAAIATPLLILFGFGFILAAIGFDTASVPVFWMIDEGLFIIGLFLGVLYSSKYISKNLTLNSRAKVITLSSIYLLILSLGLIIFDLSQYEDVTSTDILIDGGIALVEVVIFYLLSKKYIK